MENGQDMKAKSESESPEAISDASTESKPVEPTESKESTSSSPTTTADTPKGSTKTWKSAELVALKSKAGLVAAALADFQAAGGIVVAKNVQVDGLTSVKIYLVAEGVNLVAEKTPDGLDLVAVPSGS